MKRFLAPVLFLVGLAVIGGLVWYVGAGDVRRAVGALGAGVLLMVPAYLPALWLDVWSWQPLFERGAAPSFRVRLRAWWIGLSVNTLLPTAVVGGEVVRARLIMLAGTPGTVAGATVTVDQTLQATTVSAWGLIGGVWLWGAGGDPGMVAVALVTATAIGAGIVGFVLVQVGGAFGRLARTGNLSKRFAAWEGIVGSADALDAAIRALYRRTGPVLLSLLLHMAARGALAIEVWVAALLIGVDLSVADAVLVRALAGVLRGAAFFIPAGVGVQELGYVALGSFVGVSPEVMLALALAVRAREVMIAAPGLLAWQRIEMRHRTTARQSEGVSPT